MRLIATEGGRQAVLDHREAAGLTVDQLQHLRMGLEVTVLVGKRLVDYRLADKPPQHPVGFGAGRH